jgi:hypothetical protein
MPPLALAALEVEAANLARSGASMWRFGTNDYSIAKKGWEEELKKNACTSINPCLGSLQSSPN